MTSQQSQHAQTLQEHYPWTIKPLIALAPMRLISTPPLAIEVSYWGGLGFLGVGTDINTLSPMLEETTSLLTKNPISHPPDTVILPLGIGFICWGIDLSQALTILESAPLKPAAIWLFAPKDTQDLIAWTQGLRKATNNLSKIWIQIGTVSMALEVAISCNPDILVIQGSDAGGHGLAQSSSIISLLPECSDTLSQSGYGHVPLIAAGGITDGRSTVAALILGASGVCMGTRFLTATQTPISNGYKKAILDAKDGGVNTARTTVYDKIRGTVGWPEAYNARGVLNRSFWDSGEGGVGGVGGAGAGPPLTEEENKRLYEEEMKKGDEGWGVEGRMTTYAGTGVGLVREVKPAGDIVREVVRDARERLAGMAAYDFS